MRLITQDGGLLHQTSYGFSSLVCVVSLSSATHSCIGPLFNSIGSSPGPGPGRDILDLSEPLSVRPLSRLDTPLTVFMLSRLFCRIILVVDPATEMDVPGLRLLDLLFAVRRKLLRPSLDFVYTVYICYIDILLYGRQETVDASCAAFRLSFCSSLFLYLVTGGSPS